MIMLGTQIVYCEFKLMHVKLCIVARVFVCVWMCVCVLCNVYVIRYCCRMNSEHEFTNRELKWKLSIGHFNAYKIIILVPKYFVIFCFNVKYKMSKNSEFIIEECILFLLSKSYYYFYKLNGGHFIILLRESQYVFSLQFYQIIIIN